MRKTLAALCGFFIACGMAQAQSGCAKAMTHAVINATSNGDNTLIAAPSAGQKIYVWRFYVVNSHATQDENVTWKEGSSSVSGAYLLKAGGGSHTAPCDGTAWLMPAAASAVVLNLSAAGTITGEIYYTVEQQ